MRVSIKYPYFFLFDLEFYCHVNTVKVMSGQSVNLLTLFLGRLRPLSTSTCAHTFPSNWQLLCVEVLWPSQPNGVMSSAVSLPNHTFTEQA